jgi:GAF domain-containing protein
MTDEAAVQILMERRGTMYDATVVDVFIAAHKRLMPAETTMHPAAKAVGGARVRGKAPKAESASPQTDSAVAEELLGVSSLAKAVSGEASMADVGALSWMMLKQMLPCSSMGLFVPDEHNDTVVGCFAAGPHAALIRGLCSMPGDGVVGWVAAHRRPAMNAEPALDFGVSVTSLEPPLQSTLAIPLVHEGGLVAVLAVYAPNKNAFSDDHLRLVDVLSPKLAASLAAVRPAPVADGQRKQTAFTLLRGKRALR